MTASPTPGGNRLRALREYTHKTQLEVELDASLGLGYLQRVESGKVQHPERDTLERILGALGARYTERRDILELFGYIVDAPLPDKAEMAWAVEVCQPELNNAMFPVYLLDCAHQLLAWNSFVPKLFNFTPEIRVPILRVLFDPAYKFMQRVANPDVFFTAQIRALRYEMHLFHGESWYDHLLTDLLTCQTFATYWQQTASEPPHPIAARPLALLELNTPQSGLLQFRPISEPFALDRRFRVIYYLPADPHTMQQCLSWV